MSTAAGSDSSSIWVADRDLGTTEATSVVRGDFVLSPNVPVNAAPGDEAARCLAQAVDDVWAGLATPVARP